MDFAFLFFLVEKIDLFSLMEYKKTKKAKLTAFESNNPFSKDIGMI